jgi:aspartokinase/homoserine dehydrogenase 1
MAGVPGTANAIFSAVKDVGANVIMISQVVHIFQSFESPYNSLGFFLTVSYVQASSEHSICFAVPEKEVAAVSAALHARFREALAAGRLSKVILVFE